MNTFDKIEHTILDNRGANVSDIADIADVPIAQLHWFLANTQRGRKLTRNHYVARNVRGALPKWWKEGMPVAYRSYSNPSFNLPVPAGSDPWLTASLLDTNDEIVALSHRMSFGGRKHLASVVRKHQQLVERVYKQDAIISGQMDRIESLEGWVGELTNLIEKSATVMVKTKQLLLTEPVQE